MGKNRYCAKCRRVFHYCIFITVENLVENVQNRVFDLFFPLWEILGNVPKKFIETCKPLIQGEK